MRLEPESNSSVPQATESAIIGQNLQPSTLRESSESAESATKETQIAARIAALKTLQPGDIITFIPSADHLYVCLVAGPDFDGLIPVAYEIRTYKGVFAGLTPNGYACVENLLRHSSLRILRATEGAL